MAIKWCLCINATDEQWLFTKIVFWSSVAIIVCLIVWIIVLNIKDCLERRRRAKHQRRRGQRNGHGEGRFEEIL